MEAVSPKDLDAFCEMLGQASIFNGLDPADLAQIAGSLDILQAEAGETVFEEGESGDYVCFVIDGTLDILKKSETDAFALISTLTRGGSIGEMSLLDNFPRSATVRARTKTTLVRLTRKSFAQIVEQHTRVGLKIVIGLARLLSLSLRKTSSRLADYMLPLG